MFQTFSNVQKGEAMPLQQYMDNRDGGLRVGLRSITYTVGWYNIEAGESFSWKGTSGPVNITKIPPGLYGFKQLQDIIEGIGPFTQLKVNQVNGLITLTVDTGWEVLLTDGLLSILGLDDGLGGVWLNAGLYIGDHPVNFATTKVLHINLEQVSSNSNISDGSPSTLLTTIGLGCHSFGDIATIQVEHPQFKCLSSGIITELKIVIRDNSGKILDNHNLPISLTLEIV